MNIENDSLAFTWKMRPGSRDVKEYGIKLAECSGFPAQVIPETYRHYNHIIARSLVLHDPAVSAASAAPAHPPAMHPLSASSPLSSGGAGLMLLLAFGDGDRPSGDLACQGHLEAV